MKIGAIITGDIVNSTKLTVEGRDAMLQALQRIPEVLAPVQIVTLEIFRGDGFQIGIGEAREALRCGLAIRALLRAHKKENSNDVLDARISIGVGTLDYQSTSLSTSDGEAYRLSGRLLDEMHKSRLAIRTPWHGVNEELRLSTAFADDIVSGWTQSQSKTMLFSLTTQMSHLEIGNSLGISRQMVDKSLRAAKEELLGKYIRRYEYLIDRNIEQHDYYSRTTYSRPSAGRLFASDR